MSDYWQLSNLGCTAKVRHKQRFDQQTDHPQRLKLLSFNIQVAINTRAFHHYLTRSWRHLLPHRDHHRQLDSIGQLLRDYDVVALQETDAGSYRSRYTNQVEYLANLGKFPYWYQQLNRNYGRIAQHGNGILSRYHPCVLEDHRLPGLLPGRGAIAIRLGEGEQALLVIVVHLSLGKRSRDLQLNYLRELIGEQDSVIIMGDFNCHHEQLLNQGALQDLDLHPPQQEMHTYPSWRPEQALDHILVSSNIKVIDAAVLDLSVSDHLPIAMEVELPQGLI